MLEAELNQAPRRYKITPSTILGFSFLAMAIMGFIGLSVPIYLVLHLLAFGAYIMAIRKRPGISLKTIFLLAALFRLTLLFSPPQLSDDVYRYAWDARISQAGFNPFSHAPDDMETMFLRDDLWENVSHRDVKTIYPPFAQLCFKAVDSVHHSIYSLKLFFIICDLCLGWIIVMILRHKDLDARRSIWYLWNPLVVTEVAWSGHFEPLPILLLMASLLLFEKKLRLSGGVALALAASSKLLPVLMVPYLLVRKRWKAAIVFGVVFVGLYGLYIGAGFGLVSGLGEFGEHWRNNDSLFHLITIVTPSLRTAKLLAFSILLAIFIILLIKVNSDPFKFMCAALGALFLLSPTVHPWYLLWIAAFLPIFNLKSWALLTGLAALSYWTLIGFKATGAWEESLALKLIEYVPFYLLLLWEGFVYVREKHPAG